MKNISLALLAVLSILSVVFVMARATENRRKINLPTSKTLTLPVPGYIARTNSFPARIAVSPDGHYAALLNQGYGTEESGVRQSIAILDLANNQLRDFPDDRLRGDARSTRQSYFIGLAFSSDGKHLYASMGSITDPTGEKPTSTGNGIAVYKFADGQVSPERFIKIPPQRLAEGKEVAYGLRKTPAGTAIPYPAGFAVLPGAKGDRLVVANNLSDNVVLLDMNSGEVLKSFDLSRDRHVPAAYPYTVVINKAGTKAWCSLWNSAEIGELDLEAGKVSRWIKLKKVGDSSLPSSHPTAMLLSPDEKTLYVALANADVVDAVDLKSGLSFPFDPAGRHRGSVLQAIALSPDGNRIFAAAGGLDAIAVYETKNLPTSNLPDSGSYMVGSANGPRVEPDFIPTQWYPSALAIIGNDLLIATAKGEGSGPNNMKPTLQTELHANQHPYIATLIGGSIQRIGLADIDKHLAAWTRQVEDDNLLFADRGKIQFAGGKNPIHHVIYILKENRTYDQVLGDLRSGDLAVGDGDPSLTMYGSEITPNEHKLALQFGVLDNFYDSGEVSGDGHLWSTAAITSDYNEKTWQIAYRGKERTYDFQGTVADEFPLEHNQPDIDDPGTGYLWDNLARNHLTYRDYGEFVNAVWCNKPRKAASPKQGTPSAQETQCPRTELQQGDPLPPNVGDPHAGPSPFPWTVPLFNGVKPTKAVLRDHFDSLFPDFNTDYPDQLRADEFLNEFEAYSRARKENESAEFQLPAFVLLYLPDDHTGGTRPEHPRPAASVADNDLALGRVVEAVSHSLYWDDTAIFVLEDDAQDGGDHVDAHRSIAFVVSKYSPGAAAQPYVEHRFYTTVNMIHTMETLLGLPPMNQNDAYAPPMGPMFSGAGEQPAFKADYRNLKNGLIYEINRRDARGASESSKMDFSRPDAAGAAALNKVLWQDQKGDTPAPAPKHAIVPASSD